MVDIQFILEKLYAIGLGSINHDSTSLAANRHPLLDEHAASTGPLVAKRLSHRRFSDQVPRVQQTAACFRLQLSPRLCFPKKCQERTLLNVAITSTTYRHVQSGIHRRPLTSNVPTPTDSPNESADLEQGFWKVLSPRACSSSSFCRRRRCCSI